jgi:hypothetical protein
VVYTEGSEVQGRTGTLDGGECMDRYQVDERSGSLWMPMGSKESEASGVMGDGERDPVAVVDDADIVDAICQVG